MINMPFKHIRHSLASLSLLTVTGCASFLGTDYRADYAQTPKANQETATAQADAGKQPSTIQLAESGWPEYSNEVSAQPTPDTAEPFVSENPFASAAIEQPVANHELVFNDDAHITDSPVQNGEIMSGASISGDENPFVAFERDQRQNTVHEAPGIVKISAANANASTSTFRAAEPRLPGCQPGCPPAATVIVAANPYAQAYPEEYIIDGGDRDTPVHYFGGELEGLDTEDTIAEFKDHHGESHIKASNRVAVYAPRFGAVETITGPGIDVKVDHVGRARDVSGIGALHEERGMNMNVTRSPASGIAVRSGAGGVETAQPAHLGQKTDSVIQSSRVDQGLEAKTTSGLGLLALSDVHELNLQILEPATSNIKTFVGQRASTSQATQTYAMFRLASLTGSEDGGVKGEIHITKEASPLIAQSGDTVTFTIHFKNMGDYNVSEVRIIDNLTPRLRYMKGTGEVKVPDGGAGDLAVMPNKDGGQLLQFELDQPLQGGHSGTITFKARVL